LRNINAIFEESLQPVQQMQTGLAECIAIIDWLDEKRLTISVETLLGVFSNSIHRTSR
jgi:hypothetical protein